MKIKPVGDYVLVEPTNKEKKTESGIYLPDNQKADIPQDGVVIDPGKSELKIGDFVIFKMWAGEDIEIEGKKLKLIHIKDVIGVGVADKNK